MQTNDWLDAATRKDAMMTPDKRCNFLTDVLIWQTMFFFLLILLSFDA